MMEQEKCNGPITPSSFLESGYEPKIKSVPLTKVCPDPTIPCFLLYGILSPAECKQLIDASENAPNSYVHLVMVKPDPHIGTAKRITSRVMSDDDGLTTLMWNRIQKFMPETIQDETGTWGVVGLNRRWRFCKYSKTGDYVGPHFDATYWEGSNLCSKITLNVYLNSGEKATEDEPQFGGGETGFLDYENPKVVVDQVDPVSGMGLFFHQTDRRMYHVGNELTHGVKYILRSDIMYRKLDV